MKRIARSLLWTLLFLLILAAVDQFFVRVPTTQPALKAVRHFYLDFRTRLGHLWPGTQPTSVEAVIEQAEKTPVKKRPALPVVKPAAPVVTKEPSYFYADEKGELRFADSLNEVPERFRKDAQRLEQ